MKRTVQIQPLLLSCGMLSSLLYILIDLLATFLWTDYRYSSQTVSELFAIDAPTQTFVVYGFLLYDLLIYAFGLGIWYAAGGQRSLQLTAIFIVGKEILGLIGTLFFPIHLRGVEGNYSDLMHGLITAIGVFLFMFPAMIAGAVAFKGPFRWYSILTMVLFVAFGIKAGMMQTEMVADLPTPWMGIYERINIYGYMIWIVVLAKRLLKLKQPTE